MFSYFLRGALHSEKNSFGCYVYLFLARSTRLSRFEGRTGCNGGSQNDDVINTKHRFCVKVRNELFARCDIYSFTREFLKTFR